jgi:hypothetical protein
MQPINYLFIWSGRGDSTGIRKRQPRVENFLIAGEKKTPARAIFNLNEEERKEGIGRRWADSLHQGANQRKRLRRNALCWGGSTA